MHMNVAFFFFSLLQFYHDQVVVERYKMDNMVPSGPVQVLDEEDGEMRWMNGISVDDLNSDLARMRQIRDILDNSVKALYQKDDTVTKWVDKLGGFKKVQEKLLGMPRCLGPKGWVTRTLKKLRDELGYEVPPLGTPMGDPVSDSATGHHSYAVTVHRELANQRRHGLLPDPEDDSTPDWAMSDWDFNPNHKPYWWKKITMGKFRKGTLKPSKNLTQRETGSGPIWMPDIRIGDEIGGRFKHISAIGPLWLMEEHPVVKEFINRFYDDPNGLIRTKVGYGLKVRWAFGMKTPLGQYIWAPVSYPSSQKIDWYLENGGKQYMPRLKRALYYGPWIIVYMKRGEQILALKMKESQQGGLVVFTKTLYDPQEWGKRKWEAIRLGAVDAYFGYPWRRYQPPQKQETITQQDHYWRQEGQG